MPGPHPAQRVARGEDVYLRKTCPDHGDFSAVIWRGQPAFASWTRPKIPIHPEAPFTGVDRAVPTIVGCAPITASNRAVSCWRLHHAATWAARSALPKRWARAGAPDPDLSIIEGWYHRLLDAGGPFNVQLSGGEPCLRDDLPQIIALGRSLGFTFFQLNTNGLRLARDPLSAAAGRRRADHCLLAV